MITREQVKYKIVHFDKSNGSIQVFFEGLKQPVYIELHINPDGLYPVGQELDTVIKMFCPIDILNRQVAITKGIPNAGEIEKLVQKEQLLDLNDLFAVLK